MVSPRFLGLLSAIFVAGACVQTNPLYVDPTTATTADTSSATTYETTLTAGSGGTSTTGVDPSTASSDPSSTGETEGQTTIDTSNGFCGDDVIDPGEECDDGANNGDGDLCSQQCQLYECGDGLLNDGEECDEGSDNGTFQSCDDFCQMYTCGDGVLSQSEMDDGQECDEGEKQNVDGHSYTCNSDCHLSSCGDGFYAPDEQCDPGVDPAEMCTNDCMMGSCDDGETQDWEQCDPPDGTECMANCMWYPEIYIGAPTPAGLLGSDDAPSVVQNCPMWESTIGIFGSNDLDLGRVAELGSTCAEVYDAELGLYALTFFSENPAPQGPKAGMLPDEDEMFGASCPQGYLMIGVAGHADTYIERLAILCAKTSVIRVGSQWQVFMHPPKPFFVAGDEFDVMPLIQQCPPGEFVSHVKVYADSAVRGIRLFCQFIDVV